MGLSKIIKLFRTHWGARIQGNTQNNLSCRDPEDISIVVNSATPHKSNHIYQTINSTPVNSKGMHFKECEASSGISKRQLEIKIRAIAVKKTQSLLDKPAWCVHVEILKQYGLDQENIVALVSDNSSPILTTACHLPATKAATTPEKAIKQRKRKGYEHSSRTLFSFLKTVQNPRTPSSKETAKTAEVKRDEQKMDTKENKEDEGVILVKVTSVVENEALLNPPPSKKLNLEMRKPEHLASTGLAVNFEPLAPSDQADYVTTV